MRNAPRPAHKVAYAAILVTAALIVLALTSRGSGVVDEYQHKEPRIEVPIAKQLHTDALHSTAHSAVAMVARGFVQRPQADIPAIALPTTSLLVRKQTIASDTKAFTALSRKCTDKTSVHRYQEVYARALHRVRSTNAAVKLLEMGLGCIYSRCAAGGAKAFMGYLPRMAYHALEINVTVCRIKYRQSDVDAALETYIDDHLCAGSSADPAVILSCGERFGPFDVIIDDASHYHHHVTSAFRQWFLSPHFKAGGVYIVEDMQTVAIRSGEYKIAEGPRHASHPAARGATFMNHIQNIFYCKLVGMFCFTPTGGIALHSMGVFTPYVSEVIMSRESAILRKRSLVKSAAPAFASRDIIVSLSTDENAVFANAATVLVLREAGVASVPVASEAFLKAKFPNGLVAPQSSSDRFNGCMHAHAPKSCLQAALSDMESTGATFDLVWIETLANEDDQSWTDQEVVVQFIISVLNSTALKPQGVIAINGYQSRRAANEGQAQPPAGEPFSPGALQEPILRLLLDLSTTLMCCRPPHHAKYDFDREFLPFPPKYKQLTNEMYAGDISLDDRGIVYIRKMDPNTR